MAKEYDLVVLGAGPGGYIAAIRASQLGLKTAIVEKQYWGGICLNIGCIPSKALLRNAELVHIFGHRAKEFGIKVDGNVEFDYAAAFKRSRQVANRLAKGVQFLMKKNKIDSYEGWATFADANTIEVQLNDDGGSETLKFKNCIIATGSTTRLIPGTELSDNVVTYEEQIMQDNLPKSIIIAGAGAIGVEFAYIHHNYGVDVTIVEYLDRILPLEDEEVSKELHKAYDKLGIKIMTGTKVEKIEDGGKKVKVTVTSDGKEQTLEADRVLQAIGFAPRVEGYGLDNTGVELTERGAIKVNNFMQTSVPHIYAIGDVTAKLMLAHVAEAMGVVAAEHMAGHPTRELDFIMLPRATYCQPQVASFGYTEAQAREKGYDINVAKFPFQPNGKAQGLGETTGFVKLISDKKYGEILGGHMIGPDVTELLPELTLAQYAELTPEEIARNVHAHPTLGEAIKEAAHGLEGHMLNM
jgi:dihydrolipoamide dehydrogenase